MSRTIPKWRYGTTSRVPHIYFNDGEWWVLCKHANRTGPYRNLRTALEAATLAEFAMTFAVSFGRYGGLLAGVGIRHVDGLSRRDRRSDPRVRRRAVRHAAEGLSADTSD